MDRRITKTFDQVCQDILDRKNYEHVGAYELLKHEQMKRQCFERVQSTNRLHNANATLKNEYQRQFFSI